MQMDVRPSSSLSTCCKNRQATPAPNELPKRSPSPCCSTPALPSPATGSSTIFKPPLSVMFGILLSLQGIQDIKENDLTTQHDFVTKKSCTKTDGDLDDVMMMRECGGKQSDARCRTELLLNSLYASAAHTACMYVPICKASAICREVICSDPSSAPRSANKTKRERHRRLRPPFTYHPTCATARRRIWFL
jgi:hypothetical protein